MDGDTVSAGQLCQGGRGNRLRFPRPPRLADGRYVVDVDSQTHHSCSTLWPHSQVGVHLFRDALGQALNRRLIRPLDHDSQ